MRQIFSVPLGKKVLYTYIFRIIPMLFLDVSQEASKASIQCTPNLLSDLQNPRYGETLHLSRAITFAFLCLISKRWRKIYVFSRVFLFWGAKVHKEDKRQ